MKTFYCDACGSLVFFENTRCLACGHALGFLPDVLDLSAIEPEADSTVRALAEPAQGRRYRACANGRDHAVCNWLIPATESAGFCLACALNDVIPDLSVAGNRERWHRLELAKRRLVYTLLKLGLPLQADPNDQATGLRFRFLADAADGSRPLTGHADGVITINLAEADDDEREKRRVTLNEPYRTLLGHFRHEAGHYTWDRLVARTAFLEPFRQLFGDERADYAAALQHHYQHGAPADWPDRHVSAYASVHPWEDWAESTAHYFHLTDTLDTAAGFGLSLKPRHPAASSMTADLRQVAHPNTGFDALLAAWFPLTYALNSLNRSVGLPDAYPFVLSARAVEKLRFIHDVLTAPPQPAISPPP